MFTKMSQSVKTFITNDKVKRIALDAANIAVSSIVSVVFVVGLNAIVADIKKASETPETPVIEG